MPADFRRELAQLVSLFDRAPIALGVHDRDLRFVRVNETLAELNGLPADAHVGRTLAQLRPEAAAVVEPIQLQVMETGEPLMDFELTVEHATLGPRRWIAGYHPLRDRGGEVVGVGAIAVDATERIELEERLQRAERLEAIGALAGGVAHDFNNVLTSILGFAGLLEESLDEDDARRGHVAEIRRAGERAAVLTQQLLAFGGRRRLRPEALDLAALVRGTRPLLARACGEAIELVVDLPSRPLHAQADTAGLEQVLLNLVANARDATPAGGRVTVALHTDGDEAVLTVADTGAGIAPEHLERVFEPFFTTKPPGAGTGLGLSSVYGIVRQTGGTIDVESGPGSGAVFTVRLPLAAAPYPAPTAEAPRRLPSGAERILLVEDEDAVRTLAERVLVSRGYAVHTARDGEDALAVAGSLERPPDLVLTDVVMPRLDGPGLAERLESERPGTKVLYMSGYAGRGASLAPFLQKPFTPDGLAEAVRAALDAA